MKTSIALIGFMGTGKSEVGKALADKTGRELVEMDSLIEQKAGKTIPEVFKYDGEIHFRELEIEVAREVSGKKNVVATCGAGVVVNTISVDRLREDFVIICLTASPEVILRRTSADGDTRPMLWSEDKVLRIRELLKFRQPFYDRAADFKMSSSRLSADTIADKIIKRLKKNESCH